MANKNKLDQYNLKHVIETCLDLSDVGKKFAKDINLPKKDYSNLIICGMGGSALPAEILSSFFQNKGGFDLPIYICRDYKLPKSANKKSLIFISSYSGNTEETVSSFKEALKLKAQIVAFSAGGEVEKIAVKNKVPHVKFVIEFDHFQPRYAAVISFVAMLQILKNSKLAKGSINIPKVNTSSLEDIGKKLAKKIKGNTPIIYSSDLLKVIAQNWKIKINENSKTPAFWNYFPELNHNEMVGFTNPQAKFIVIFLTSNGDSASIKKRMETTSKLYAAKGLKTEHFEIKGKNFLEKLFYGLALGDWVSYYLALEYKQDPTPVDMVEELKAKLKK